MKDEEGEEENGSEEITPQIERKNCKNKEKPACLCELK